MIYKAYHRQIIGNVVSYIADRFYKAKGYYIYQMVMYKILAFFDFQCVKQLGSPCTELDFRARRMGPVPDELYNNDEFVESFSEFSVINSESYGQSRKQFKCDCEPDMDFISPKEKRILDEIVDRFIAENIDAKKASDLSHKEIKAWRKAYERTPNSQMLYADEFDRNIFTEKEDELTLPEYNLRMYNEIANA